MPARTRSSSAPPDRKFWISGALYEPTAAVTATGRRPTFVGLPGYTVVSPAAGRRLGSGVQRWR
ncbi:hypothetical protein FRAAL1330 [Frankia alni ACN14a]|uniref:Uncharacterized protein n=1 Tax=Frankia alni (strain DSM 45986 / CECT 9034 / ACN14a) TaxID=326424 RepID=Q0RR33_FRAAA|nr:hypothetical protein FRAAL1330 [Frankia alni ACN14a]